MSATIRICIIAFGQQGARTSSIARSSTAGIKLNAAAYFSPVTATGVFFGGAGTPTDEGVINGTQGKGAYGALICTRAA